MTRRRRRILITAVVAVLLLLGFGYQRTRLNVDARFLGQWSIYAVQGSIPDDVSGSPSMGRVTYSADGSATSTFGPQVQQSFWGIDRQGMFTFRPSVRDARAAFMFLRDTIAEYVGGHNLSKVRLWKIIEATENRIVLQNLEMPNQYLVQVRIEP